MEAKIIGRLSSLTYKKVLLHIISHVLKAEKKALVASAE